MKNKRIILLAAATLFVFCLTCYPENIDPCDTGSQYAYSENAGWFNFEPNQGPGVTVSFAKLTGYVWGENIGWINLDPNICDPNVGIRNNGTGQLSGYAWAENIGWINFNPKVPNDSNHYGVTIDNEGYFHGWAWGDNIGWIKVNPQVSDDPNHYGVRTSWPPECLKSTAPSYEAWVAFGKPDCWCYRRQCQGDADGLPYGKSGYGVSITDLAILKKAWNKRAEELVDNEICADFDYLPYGKNNYRVSIPDLAILKRNFNVVDLPDCNMTHINEWRWPLSEQDCD
jgi:hypothetical protein